MIHTTKTSLWKQFGASIDMLKNAITTYPESDWNTGRKFYYIAYHTLVFLDYYLTIPLRHFTAPLPFSLREPADRPEDAVDDVVPDNIYSKQELLDYLQAAREKCRALITGLTEESIIAPWIPDKNAADLELCCPDALDYPTLEILLYNMRHVQHHAAQLNLLLRQSIHEAPDWVSQAEDLI